MPCISGSFDANVGVLLQVGVLTGGSLAEARQHAQSTGSSETQFTGAGANALVDTGASMTCISPQLAKQLSLSPRGKVDVRGATGARPVNAYHVDLFLGLGAQSFVIENLDVCGFESGLGPFQVLAGRDVLCRGVFTMDFSGHFTFSI